MRWLRRILRGRTQRWVLASVAALAVLLIGLLSQGFLNSPGSASGGGPTLGSGDTPVPSPSVSSADAQKTRAHTARRANQYPSGIPQSVLDKLPANPLNHLHGGTHTVVISVTSAAHIPTVGYLVPTGLTHAYGVAHPSGRAWSLSQQALGPGYLAAVFIQADRSGARVTCTVTVDGKQTNSETAASPYARAVCLG